MANATQVDVLLAGVRDASGLPLAGGKVYAYIAGTTIAKALYTTLDKSIAAANPVILDSNGRASVFGDGVYKFVVKTSADVTLYTWDGLTYQQIDSKSIWCGNATGATNAYVVAPSPTISTLVSGEMFTFVPNANNTGACTLNVSGIGAVSIKTAAGGTPSNGAIVSGEMTSVIYDTSSGARFLLTSTTTYTNLTISGALVAASADINGGTIDNVTITGGSVAANSISSGIGIFTGNLTALGLSLSNDVAITDGGTGASTVAAARTNLGLGTADNVTFANLTSTSFGGSLAIVAPGGTGQFDAPEITSQFNVTTGGTGGFCLPPISTWGAGRPIFFAEAGNSAPNIFPHDNEHFVNHANDVAIQLMNYSMRIMFNDGGQWYYL